MERKKKGKKIGERKYNFKKRFVLSVASGCISCDYNKADFCRFLRRKKRGKIYEKERNI